MTTEAFEQAKREFAEKYNPLFGSRLDEVREKTKSEFLSDLTALLEQHKKMMLREELEKFQYWANEDAWVYISQSVIDDYLLHLLTIKNVKK